MGTYTANKNLYMPTVGEQGWGTLMNTNLSTIDNFLKPITVSGSTYTFTGNHVGNHSGGSISATSITNSGTLTQTGTSTFTGKITANGGIGTTSLTTSSTITSTGQIVANGGVKGNLTGNVTGLLFVKGTVGTSGDVNYATLAAQELNITAFSSSSPNTIKVNNYSIVYGNPVKHGWGVYTRRSDLSGTTSPSVNTRNVNIKVTVKSGVNSGTTIGGTIYYKNSTDTSYTAKSITLKGGGASTTVSFTGTVGTTYQFYMNDMIHNNCTVDVTIPAGTTYKVKYATP